MWNDFDTNGLWRSSGSREVEEDVAGDEGAKLTIAGEYAARWAVMQVCCWQQCCLLWGMKWNGDADEDS